ncbi:hypothetical protein [Burkholderia vietnamiensis]|uniref:hypothetical protein n=1 Tax=Burkholderia vietnamiensis TaxID=60552 RepID=UPI001CAF04F3|nr:hypothetical protein [Burkholderia vietnamiensis]CAG9229390.1 hypothetical protein BVI1335_70202 [Burkholderia vietnamiensis]HDR9086274.1 hypothetical protein [Burkholderia vietnamiensis]
MKAASTTVSLIGGIVILLMLARTVGLIDFEVCVAGPGECHFEVIHKSGASTPSNYGKHAT